jgi:hypothetical protein
MKLRFIYVAIAAVLAFAAASFNVQVHAQTKQLAIIGSSAQYYDALEADIADKGCFFLSDGSSDANKGKDGVVTDSRTAPVTTDKVTFWVAWSKGGGTCAAPTAPYLFDFYLNSDSVVGLRCFFADPACAITLNNPNGAAPTAWTCSTRIAGCTPLPVGAGSLTAVINGETANGALVNAAATDIRPEDGKFAINRALTACGSPMAGVAGSQYLGLGYQTATANVGNPVGGAVWTVGGAVLPGGTFNVVNFNITGNDPIKGAGFPVGGDSTGANGTGWEVFQAGAAPVLVLVDTKDSSGLGSLAVSNINRHTYAGFLDGTFGAVSDLIPQTYSAAEIATNVMVREPLSGTFNTNEYGIPNSVEIQSSSEVGLAAALANGGTVANPGSATQTTFSGTETEGPFPAWNCGTPPAGVTGDTFGGTSDTVAPYNPLEEQDEHGGLAGGASTRSRAIGTSNMVSNINSAEDSLGYAFWGVYNYLSTNSANVKYLTLDGVDPIQQVWTDGSLPTPGTEAEGNVTFAHVKDGSYPDWSILRMVTSTVSTSACNVINDVATAGGSTCNTLLGNLVSEEQSQLNPDLPDFVKADELQVVRSHFTPPGVTFPGNGGAACNGDISASLDASAGPEAGGDVGGVVYSIQADNDSEADTGNNCGILNQRQ